MTDVYITHEWQMIQIGRLPSFSLGAANLGEFWFAQKLFCILLSIAILLQFLIFISPSFFTTSSSRHNLGLPVLLTTVGLYSVILFTVHSSSILTICPIDLILCALTCS